MVKGEREGFQLDHRLFKTDGSTAWLRWIAWRVPGSQGESACGLVMAEDITEHRHCEQRLRQAERLAPVGREAGRMAPPCTNLPTGVPLICYLLLRAFD